MPSSARYLWDWYWHLSDRLRRVRDGAVEPIPPTEYLAWREATGHIVYSSEYAILAAMDAAFCGEMGKELSDFQERQRQAQIEEAEKRGRRK